MFSSTVQRAMAACGAAFLVVFGLGLLIADFLPPIPPDFTAAEVAERYTDDAERIRVGTLFMLIGLGFTLPFAAVVTHQMRRIEGRHTPLSTAQLVAGGVNVLAFTIPTLIFAAAAYRPDRNPEVLQALNDVAWFMLLMDIPCITIQAVVVAIAIFRDRNPDPVFPRWVGYFLLWAALLFAPGFPLTFFKTGPFAWDGLLAFWVAFAAFVGWYLVMVWATFRAISQEERTAPADPNTPDPNTPASTPAAVN